MNSFTVPQQGITLKNTQSPPRHSDERLYFAGLKNSGSLPQNDLDDRNTSLMGYITDTLSNNPLTSIGAGMITGIGLYYGLAVKKPIPEPTVAQNYANAMQAVIANTAMLVGGHGVIKYLTQESLETTKLNHDIAVLKRQRSQKHAKKSAQETKTDIIVPNKHSFSIAKEVAELFIS